MARRTPYPPRPPLAPTGMNTHRYKHTYTTLTRTHPYTGNFNCKWGNRCEIPPLWTFSWTFSKTYLYRRMHRRYLCEHGSLWHLLLFFNLPLKSDTHWAIWYTLHNLSFYVGLSLITTCVPEHSHASEFTGFSMLISLILNMVFSYTYIYPTEYVRSSMTYQT